MATETLDAGLKKLEYLSLVSKVCTELETHLGFGDKVLAEFITDMGRKCETVDEFDSKLKESGAEMPDYFVRTLLTIIHAILPPKPKSVNEKKEDVPEGKKSRFPGLSIADTTDRAKQLEREIEMETRDRVRAEQEEQRRERDRSRDRGRDKERDREKDRYRDSESKMDKFRKPTALFLFCLIVLLSPQFLSVIGDGQDEGIEKKEEDRSVTDKFKQTLSISTVSSFDKVRSFMRQMQIHLFPPNLDFRRKEVQTTGNGGGGDLGSGERMKEAVEKSIKKSKEAVEESAKSAAQVAREAAHKAAEKLKDRAPGDREL